MPEPADIVRCETAGLAAWLRTTDAADQALTHLRARLREQDSGEQV
jgi:hypothetical protein